MRVPSRPVGGSVVSTSALLERINERARTSPGRPALTDGDRSVTFGRLREEITSCADFLRTCGVRGGEAVGVLLPNGIPFVAALLGIARIGGVAILLPTTLTAAELRRYCGAAGAKIVLTAAPLGRLVKAAGGSAVRHRHDRLLTFAFIVSSAGDLRPGGFIVQLTSGTDQHP